MILVEEISRTFPLPDGRELRAVDAVSFSVPAGEVFGLLGPNGAGKTTTLRMLLGLLQPTSGRAVVAGYSSRDQPEEVKRRVGLVSASAGLYPYLSVREMLLFFADLYGLESDQAGQELQTLAPTLGLSELLDRRCGTLSTGQKQRVNFARALIHQPPVLLLDEPTLGLDVRGCQLVFDLGAHVRTQGNALILPPHGLDQAERLCDRFGLLHCGRLIQTGRLEELQAATGCEHLVDMFLMLSKAGPALTVPLPVAGAPV